MLTLLRLSLRQMVGVRLLLALLVTALAVGLSVLVAALTGDEGVQGEMIGVLFDGLMIGAILPIVTMVLATAAFGNELESAYSGEKSHPFRK